MYEKELPETISRRLFGGPTIMNRLILIAVVLSLLAGASAVCALIAPAQQRSQLSSDKDASEPVIAAEAWPICSSIASLAEGADWAALDPDFAAGKRAIVAGDWNRAIKVRIRRQVVGGPA